jgi:hypothetical protein
MGGVPTRWAANYDASDASNGSPQPRHRSCTPASCGPNIVCLLRRGGSALGPQRRGGAISVRWISLSWWTGPRRSCELNTPCRVVSAWTHSRLKFRPRLRPSKQPEHGAAKLGTDPIFIHAGKKTHFTSIYFEPLKMA